MVADNFPRALRLVLVDEGGLDDDPHDHGGRTAHGIIQREYDGFRARHGLPRQDVWKITPAEYTEIYHDRYWMPWCDRLPAGMDYAFFDACVNAGPAQAARTLQKALGIRTDGNMGDITLAKVQEIAARAPRDGDEHDADASGIEPLIHAFCEARRAFYRALAQFPRYGRGWLARVDHVERAAKAFAADAEQAQRNGLADDLKAQASAKAKAEATAAPAVSTETAAAAATGSGIAAGFTEQISAATSQLSPFQDAIHVVKYILLGLALVSIGLTVYAVMHRAKIKEATG
jgi:lysozyme family protein